MKNTLSIAFLFISCLNGFSQDKLDIEQGEFKPSYESLQNYKCPDWFQDAKFGIIAHFGPKMIEHIINFSYF